MPEERAVFNDVTPHIRTIRVDWIYQERKKRHLYGTSVRHPTMHVNATVTYSYRKQHRADIRSSSSSHGHQKQQEQEQNQAPTTPNDHILANFSSAHTSTDLSPVLSVRPSKFCSTIYATSTSSTYIVAGTQQEHSQKQR